MRYSIFPRFLNTATYYFHYIIQQLMKMNIMKILLYKRSLFRKTAEKAIVLNYEVINDVMMMQCIYQ